MQPRRFRGAARRALLAAAAGCALPAAATSRRALAKLGVFAVLGDVVEVSVADVATDTRLDRSQRDRHDVPAIGFDLIVMRTLLAELTRRRPKLPLAFYRAPQAMAAAEQRALAQGARNAELPGWIVQTIPRDALSHLLIVTRHRAPAAFPLVDGHTLGRGTVEGIGFHLDGSVEIGNAQTREVGTGLLGAHALLELTLLDAVSGELVLSRPIHEQHAVPPPRHTSGIDPWSYLDPAQRIELLRKLVERCAVRSAEVVAGAD